MVSNETFTIPFLQRCQRQLEISDVTILERTVHAFCLLERMTLSKLDFVFKGWTSLMLLLDKPLRISTDIDIVCRAPEKQFEDELKKWIRFPPFTRWERDYRASDTEPPCKRHYFVFFNSQFGDRMESYVILDVVAEDCGIKAEHTICKLIDCQFLKLEGTPSQVTIPTVDALLGDKLTAFAPNTTGVSFHDPRRLGDSSHQVLKQLFDIGQLFDHLTDLRVVRDSYFSVLEKEGGYRKITGLPECALYDTLQTSYEICTFESRRQKLPNDEFIRKGIKSMASDLINQTQFSFPQARVAAAKAAYLVALLLTDGRKKDYAQNEDVVAELKMYEFPKELGVLNPLKKVSAEAFWYWREIYRMLPNMEKLLR